MLMREITTGDILDVLSVLDYVRNRRYWWNMLCMYIKREPPLKVWMVVIIQDS